MITFPELAGVQVNLFLLIFTGFGAGILSGFAGVGGAFIVTPALIVLGESLLSTNFRLRFFVPELGRTMLVMATLRYPRNLAMADYFLRNTPLGSNQLPPSWAEPTPEPPRSSQKLALCFD